MQAPTHGFSCLSYEHPWVLLLRTVWYKASLMPVLVQLYVKLGPFQPWCSRQFSFTRCLMSQRSLSGAKRRCTSVTQMPRGPTSSQEATFPISHEAVKSTSCYRYHHPPYSLGTRHSHKGLVPLPWRCIACVNTNWTVYQTANLISNRRTSTVHHCGVDTADFITCMVM